MKIKAFVWYGIALALLPVGWYYQFENSMQRQRFVAVNIGVLMVEMQAMLEKGKTPPEEIRMKTQKDLQGLNIEIYGKQIGFLGGKLNVTDSLKQLAALNGIILNIAKRDDIDDYYFYGKKWAVVKMLLAPLCESKKSEQRDMPLLKSELRSLLNIEAKLARRNDRHTLALSKKIDAGTDFRDSCKEILEKVPMHTLARLMHRIDVDEK